MNSQYWVIILAFVIALVMALKPEMCIPNPDHRTPNFVRAIKYIGMTIALMLAIWLSVNLLR